MNSEDTKKTNTLNELKRFTERIRTEITSFDCKDEDKIYVHTGKEWLIGEKKYMPPHGNGYLPIYIR